MRIMHYFIFLGLIVSGDFNPIQCSPNCVAHSSNLAEPCDNHDYRPVSCNCSCRDTNKQGKCVAGRNGQVCGHMQIPGYGTSFSSAVMVRSTDVSKLNAVSKQNAEFARSLWYSPSQLFEKNIIQGKIGANNIKHAHAHKQTNKHISRVKLAFLSN